MKAKPIIAIFVAAAALSLVASDKAREHEIVQKDKEFSKTEIVVKAGESVVFKNDDSVTHNVFSNSKANPFTIKIQKPSESSTVEFVEEGVTEVRCAIHPKMKLIVRVEK